MNFGNLNFSEPKTNNTLTMNKWVDDCKKEIGSPRSYPNYNNNNTYNKGV